MRVLVACEFSQVVCRAFRERGHEAYSCDVLPTEGNPEWHIQDDVLKHLDDGWDLMIAHPPCTYLTVTGNKWMKPEFKDRFPDRQKQREEAIKFFLALANAPIKRTAIENPVGIMSSVWRKPDQYIQPYNFGNRVVKKTALWLKNLPPLFATEIVEPEYITYNSSTHPSGKSRYPIAWSDGSNGHERSRFFPGVAEAMATQWGRE